MMRINRRLAYLRFKKGHDGLPKIIENEAKLVRLIYSLFLDGKTAHGIAKHLMAAGIPAPGGNEKWHWGTINNILTNEKFKGDYRLQKAFTVDFLTKMRKINEGEGRMMPRVVREVERKYALLPPPRLIRVCAYVRVSTGSIEQQSSLQNQSAFFTVSPGL